jgi:ClpP class serine protease
MRHAQIAQRAFNTPLLVEPRKAAAFLRGLGPRILGSAVRPVAFVDDEDVPAAAQPFATLLGDDLTDSIRRGDRRGYALVEGVAVIPVSGVLVHRGAWLGESSGETSYEGLRAQIDAAVADPMVRAIALEIDSFGGEVAGCFDLADHIAAVGRVKPVRAFVAEHAYSAAYALASQAEHVTVPRSGGVGSIGVVCMHVDVSEALKDEGIAVTLVHAGAHKIDGNQFQPLPEAVREEMQAEMEALRDIFVATVAQGRGSRLTARAAAATEARCLRADAAVAAGLADAVAEPRAAFASWIEQLKESAAEARSRGGPIMAKATQAARSAGRITAQAAEEDEERMDESAAEAAEDGPAEDDEDMEAAASGEGDEDEQDETPAAAAAERRRIAAILDAPEAQGRETLARHLALRTSMTPGAARAALKAAPSAIGGRLAAAMSAAEDRVAVPSAGSPNGVVSAAALMKERFAAK